MSERNHGQDDTTQPLGSGLFRRALGLGGGPMAYPAIDAVWTHWETLRAGRTAPARAEIDPRPLADALPHLFVAELVAPGIARLRLCGQHLNDVMGMEPRGMPLSVFVEPETRDDLAAAVKQVAQGVRVVLPLRAGGGFARPAIDGRMALLPLTDAQGRITRILGVLETHGPVGRAPRRFVLGSPLMPAGQPGVPASPAPAPAAPAPTVSASTAPVSRGERPAFRVIQGGKS